MRQPIAGAVLLLGACSLGSRPSAFPPAQAPGGATTTLSVQRDGQDGPRQTLRGELIAVSDSGVVVLVPPARFIAAGWSDIHSFRLEGMAIRHASGRQPEPGELKRVRLVSRFPQGFTGTLRDSVLASYNATVETP